MNAKKSRPISTFLRSNKFLVAFLALFIILRIPSLFEPHWYGDEGVYASIAYALEHGKRMYLDIFDNRLPGIYYIYALASSDNRQLVVRIFSIITGVITLLGIYAVGKKLQLSKFIYIILPVAVFFLGTPKIEGTIANTEVFFLPLTIWATYLALSEKKAKIFLAGCLFGAAFMIKFLPFFTMAAVGLYLLLINRSYKENLQKCLALGTGFAVFVGLGFAALLFQGNLAQAVQYGLLNNGSYVEYYSQEGIPATIRFIGFVIVLALIISFYLVKRISGRLLFLLLFLLFDFFAAIFSGRKYEHYLLQIVPAFSLFCGYLISYLISKRNILSKVVSVIASIVIFVAALGVFYKGSSVAVGMRVIEYYKEFVLSSLHIHYEPRMLFSFYREPARLKVVDLIEKRYQTNNIYFYSDDPWVYDYAHIVPPTFFVAIYHQELVPSGAQRLVSDLKRHPVDVIAVDKNVAVSSEMNMYLSSRYTQDLEDTYYRYFIPLDKNL